MLRVKVLILLTVIISVSCQEKKVPLPHPHGLPDTFIYFPQGKSIIVDQNAVKMLETLGDYKVAVYSIIGGFRLGKSFLMNYCLRYLYANYKSVNYMSNPLNAKSEWMGVDSDPLVGFGWRSGKKSETAGIIIWSDIFLYENGDEKIAIVLMDSQGIFDTRKDDQDTMTTYVLNSLFSSFLIYYEDTQITEKQLNFMQVNIDYTKIIANENKNVITSETDKPFQNLLILIRNWPNYDDFDFGLQGGNGYVNKTLNSQAIQQNSDTRDNIKSAYEQINGFLLPYPGKTVATDANYDGSWYGMDELYKKHLTDLIEWMFSPKNLVKKKFFGQYLNGKDYFNFLINYCEAFRSQDHPDITSIYEMTVNNQMSILLRQSLDFYKSEMAKAEKSFSLNEQYEQSITNEHNKAKEAAIKMFKSEMKIGSEKIHHETLQKVINSIDNDFIDWKARNQNVFLMIKTMKNQLNAQIEITEKKIANMTIGCQNDMQGLKNQIASITQSKKKLDDQNKEQAAKHTKDMNDMKATLIQSAEDCKNKITSTSTNYNNQITKLKNQHASDLMACQNRCKEDESTLNKKIQQLQLNIKVQTNMNKIEKELAELEKKEQIRKIQARLDRTKNNYEEENKSLRKTIEDITKASGAGSNELKSKITKLYVEINQCENKNKKCEYDSVEQATECTRRVAKENMLCNQKVQNAMYNCHC